MPLTPNITYSGNILQPYWPGARTDSVAFMANLSMVAGTILGQQSTSAANAKQTITIGGTPTGGTFTLTFQGQTTSALAYNITTAALTTALEALSTIGAGNVSTTGTAGSSYAVSFIGAMADQAQPLMTTTAALTGGTSPTATVASTTTGETGVAFGPYASGNSDGTQVAKAILKYDITTDNEGRVTHGLQIGGGEQHETYLTGEVYVEGRFATQDLTGLDSTAVGDLGRIVEGNTTTGVLALI